MIKLLFSRKKWNHAKREKERNLEKTSFLLCSSTAKRASCSVSALLAIPSTSLIPPTVAIAIWDDGDAEKGEVTEYANEGFSLACRLYKSGLYGIQFSKPSLSCRLLTSRVMIRSQKPCESWTLLDPDPWKWSDHGSLAIREC